MLTSITAAVLPPILRLVRFRRIKADIVEDFGPEGQAAQIGESLQPFEIITVELDAAPSQRQMMRQTHMHQRRRRDDRRRLPQCLCLPTPLPV